MCIRAVESSNIPMEKEKEKEKRKRKKRESYKTVDFGQDRKRVVENRRENEWEKCLVRREKGREK